MHSSDLAAGLDFGEEHHSHQVLCLTEPALHAGSLMEGNSTATRGPPRRSESSVSSQPQPAKKVVGFHVEGLPQSPAPHNTLLADSQHATTTSGSPNPVIIPPSFQVTWPACLPE